MRVFYNSSDAAGLLKRAVVTTGSFDGVHIGHKMIINRLNQIASDIGGESVLITFHPHPRKVLYPEQKDLKLINSQEEKINLLRKAGLENLIIIPFTMEFSKTSSHDFVTNILIGELDARVIVVGHNHHFGHNRMGDYSYLHSLSKDLGFSVEEIPLQDIENETVSSTKIRKALFEGNIQRANAYLDHQYIINGILRQTNRLTPAPNFPSLGIEIPEKEKLVPPTGIYATNLLIDNQYLKAVTFISSMEEEIPAVETHLLYDSHELFDKSASLYFYKKVSDLDFNTEGHLLSLKLDEVLENVEDLIY